MLFEYYRHINRLRLWHIGTLTVALVMAGGMSEKSQAQAPIFSSQSTGADGALNLTTPGTIYFDPKSFNPPLNPAGDNIFNFTTINIAAGVNVIFSPAFLTGPVFWLASGAVTINGNLNLDGSTGYQGTNLVSNRFPSTGGAGGFGGGVGGGGGQSPQAGNGPGGGAAATVRFGGSGTFTGNQYLVPLIGGSGGGGALSGAQGCGTTYGGGGGGGGGAILIASSTSITLKGSVGIYARGGGAGCDGGGGSGGAIRLIATTINSDCSGGCPSLSVGGTNAGVIRVEAFSGNLSTGNTIITGTFLTSVPFALALPATPPPSIRVTSINSVTINANPFTFPDIMLNSASAVTVNIEGHFIPIGTVPKVYVFSETGPDQILTASPLNGTLALTTSTLNITFPLGGSRGFVKTAWTTP